MKVKRCQWGGAHNRSRWEICVTDLLLYHALVKPCSTYCSDREIRRAMFQSVVALQQPVTRKKVIHRSAVHLHLWIYGPSTTAQEYSFVWVLLSHRHWTWLELLFHRWERRWWVRSTGWFSCYMSGGMIHAALVLKHPSCPRYGDISDCSVWCCCIITADPLSSVLIRPFCVWCRWSAPSACAVFSWPTLTRRTRRWETVLSSPWLDCLECYWTFRTQRDLRWSAGRWNSSVWMHL